MLNCDYIFQPSGYKHETSSFSGKYFHQHIYIENVITGEQHYIPTTENGKLIFHEFIFPLKILYHYNYIESKIEKDGNKTMVRYYLKNPSIFYK